MSEEYSKAGSRSSGGILRWVGRMIVTAIVLAIVSLLTPGFSIRGLWSYVIAAVVISVLDSIVEAVMKSEVSPFGKGLRGFIISAVILYVTQYFVPNMVVTVWGAILSALVIGIVDAILPSRVM